MALPRLIVTRPQPEADLWVAQLRHQGLEAQALPLIDIGPAMLAADQQASAQARAHWQRYGALMLVSGNAAQYFLDADTALALNQQAPGTGTTRVWCPGPGTANAAIAQGLAPAWIDQPAAGAEQLDSESLWAQVARQVPAMAVNGQRVLIVRGADSDQLQAGGNGRHWLSAQLQAAGVGVDWVAVYERREPTWSAEQTALAQAALADGSVWLFSSSQAVMHLRNKFASSALAGRPALATHPRIAQAAQQAGFAPVKQCRPAVADVVASLESGL